MRKVIRTSGVAFRGLGVTPGMELARGAERVSRFLAKCASDDVSGINRILGDRWSVRCSTEAEGRVAAGAWHHLEGQSVSHCAHGRTSEPKFLINQMSVTSGRVTTTPRLPSAASDMFTLS